ncbi:MAG: hypothetical protein ABIV42_07540 [Nitrosospira sp.]
MVATVWQLEKGCDIGLPGHGPSADDQPASELLHDLAMLVAGSIADQNRAPVSMRA